MKITVLFFLVCVLLTGCASDRISQVIAFGDELSDNGAGLLIYKQAFAAGEMDQKAVDWYEKYHWEGRLSNGPVAVEVMAEQLGVELEDYAIGGARSGYGNVFVFLLPSLKNTGLLAQVEQFTQDLNGKKADPDALYFLEASIDDFFDEEDEYNEKAIDERTDQNVANMVTAVTKLANLGARHFMVGKSADLARQPRFRMAGLTSEAETYQNLLNTKLVSEMASLEQQLDIKIDLFDYIALDDRIWANPDQYGFVNLVDQCLSSDGNWNGTPCNSPDDHFWWDDFTHSRRAHQLIGEAMAEQLNK